MTMKLNLYIQGSDGGLYGFDVMLKSALDQDVTTEEQFIDRLVDHIHQRFNVEED